MRVISIVYLSFVPNINPRNSHKMGIWCEVVSVVMLYLLHKVQLANAWAKLLWISVEKIFRLPDVTFQNSNKTIPAKLSDRQILNWKHWKPAKRDCDGWLAVSYSFFLYVGFMFVSKYVQFDIICSLKYSIHINTVEVDPPQIHCKMTWWNPGISLKQSPFVSSCTTNIQGRLI